MQKVQYNTCARRIFYTYSPIRVYIEQYRTHFFLKRVLYIYIYGGVGYELSLGCFGTLWESPGCLGTLCWAPGCFGTPPAPSLEEDIFDAQLEPTYLAEMDPRFRIIREARSPNVSTPGARLATRIARQMSIVNYSVSTAPSSIPYPA